MAGWGFLRNSFKPLSGNGSVTGNAARELRGVAAIADVLTTPLTFAAGLGVRGLRWGAGAAWRNPVKATLLVGVPTAVGVMNFRKEKPHTHAKQQMAEVAAAQQEIGQVQDVLGQMEAAQPPMQLASQPQPVATLPLVQNVAQPVAAVPQPVAPAPEVRNVAPPVVNVPQTLQLANPQIAANSVVEQGRVADEAQLARA